MTTLLVVLVALVGVAVGSFLNVLIWRLPRGESVVRPPSHCPRCDTPLASRDNVPIVSWLILRRRCRHCREPISARYPAVELVTALLFVGMALRFGLHPELAAYLYLAAIAVTLSLIDLDVKRLPDRIVLPSYLVTAALLTVAAVAGHDYHRLLRAGEGMAAYYGGFFALAFAYPAGMGFGDVKLAGVLGLFLGWLGWGVLAVGVFGGVALGGVVGIALLVAGRAGRKTAIPFGPFMLIAALTAVFVGAPLARGYAHLTFGG